MAVSSTSCAPAEGRPERIAGRYELVERIAQGGMGEVFRARELATGRELALKRLLPAAHKRKALFRSEYQVLARLKHPFIIEVYEFGIDKDLPYYTMELLDGYDLRESPRVGIEESCRILRDVACSLALLHGQRLLHRDVSPRNVRRTQSGVCKLLDFGTMVPFGVPPNVAGTPPFISPEAWEGGQLDQRSDLYSLGALAYWMFSRRLPGSARSLDRAHAPREKLPALRKVAKDVPAALEALVMSMLAFDPSERPGSATEVIARLSAIASLPSTDTTHLAQSHLGSSRFVGQKRALAKVEKLMRRALLCNGHGALVEGVEGSGKTRFLQEVSLLAQAHGFSVARAFAAHSATGSTVARELYRALRRAAPEAFELLPASEREVLQSFDWQQSSSSASAPADTRARLSWALAAYVRVVSRASPWLLLVDDLDQADEFSAALVASLSSMAETLPLLVVATAQSAGGGLTKVSLVGFAERAQRLSLVALDENRTRTLVSNLFGRVPNRERLVSFLYREAHGNPALTMELCQILLQRGVVRYLDGDFVLPEGEIREQLPAGTALSFSSRLEGVSCVARELAELIATCRGGASLDLCLFASEARNEEVLNAINELVSRGVLMGSGQEYAFAQETLRSGVRLGISAARERQLHERLARAFMRLGGAGTLRQLEAAWHLVHTDREREGAELLASVAPALIENGVSYQHAIEGLEKALEVLDRLEASLEVRLGIRTLLARAAYLYDFRLVDRYSGETIRMLYEWCGMAFLERWRRLLPGRLALLFSVLIICFRRLTLPERKRGPSALVAIKALARAVLSTMGVRVTALDRAAALSLLARLWVFQHASERSSAPAVYKAAEALALQPFGRESELKQKLAVALHALERRLPRGMRDEERQHLRVGLLVSGGLNECYRLGSSALACADELALQDTHIAHVAAHRVRFTYYVTRGMRDRADEFRRALDLYGIQGGTTWQMEWFAAPIEGMSGALLDDVVIAGQALERLTRLALEIPSLVPMRDMVKVGYHMRRGEHAVAIELGRRFVAENPPGSVIGWASGYSALAAALNDSQRFGEAARLCQGALKRVQLADLEYALMYCMLSYELAIARAGCGDFAQAHAILDAYIDRFEQSGEYALLTHALACRVKLARMASDSALLTQTLVAMRAAAERSESETVLTYAAKVTHASLRGTADMEPAAEPGRSGAADLESSDATPAHGVARTRRRTLLRRVMERVKARAAFVFVLSEGDHAPRLAAFTGEPLPLPLLTAALAPLLPGLSDRSGERSVGPHARLTIEARDFEVLSLPRDTEDESHVVLLLEGDRIWIDQQESALLLGRLAEGVRSELSLSQETSDSLPDSDVSQTFG